MHHTRGYRQALAFTLAASLLLACGGDESESLSAEQREACEIFSKAESVTPLTAGATPAEAPVVRGDHRLYELAASDVPLYARFEAWRNFEHVIYFDRDVALEVRDKDDTLVPQTKARVACEEQATAYSVMLDKSLGIVTFKIGSDTLGLGPGALRMLVQDGHAH